MKASLKDIIFYSVIFVISLVFIFFIFTGARKIILVANQNINKGTPTIVIDAGHGGEDGGATSGNILEKDINLKIAKNLELFFKVSGFKTIMIREDDISLSEDESTVRERKVSDLHNRLDIVNSTDNCVLISVHQNKFADSKYYGAQVFYSVNNQQSKEIAQGIQTSVRNILQNDNKREIKPGDKSIYLIYNAKVPAVLVECGFLSNSRDRILLNDAKYQKEIAFSIYSGFMNYWRNLQKV
jgi:N-acetylmuramoyl-L-alanine amidase